MTLGVIGKKLGMTQIFDSEGLAVPVTVIQVGKTVVTQVKTVETDGYNAIQLGYGDVKENRINRPEKGHFAKAGVSAKRYLKEYKERNQ